MHKNYKYLHILSSLKTNYIIYMYITQYMEQGWNRIKISGEKNIEKKGNPDTTKLRTCKEKQFLLFTET